MGTVRLETLGRPVGCKLIRLSAEVEDGVIRRLSIRGDFFAAPGEGFDRAEARMAGVPLAGSGRVFDALLAQEGVEASGIHGAALEELLAGAAAADSGGDHHE
ncbi:MAG: hypothetical protein LBD31_04565 [Treponema sp.]|nr:hypothetical protein [Treponema sp.]